MKATIPIISTAPALAVSAAFAGGGSDNGSYKNSIKDRQITLIHMGDLHGQTVPRPNLRTDGDGRMEGDLARMYTEIRSIRKAGKNAVLVNTGDTIQGAGEALYSRGQALIDVVDLFGIDAFVPGNWEYVYGPERFKEFFADGTGKSAKGNRWGLWPATCTTPRLPTPMIRSSTPTAISSPARRSLAASGVLGARAYLGPIRRLAQLVCQQR
jgi:hypothetical protein